MRQAVYRYRVRLGKFGDMRFIGHLDFAREFERGLRRAGVPMAYSQGFNPRPRISFASALALGMESEAEYADIYTVERFQVDELTGALNGSLVTGIRVNGLRSVPLDGVEPASAVAAAAYEVSVPGRSLYWERLDSILGDFLRLESISWRRAGRGDIREIDMRREILGLEIGALEPIKLRMVLKAGIDGAVRPHEVLQAVNSFCGSELLKPEEALIRRTEMYFSKGGKLRPLFEV